MCRSCSSGVMLLLLFIAGMLPAAAQQSGPSGTASTERDESEMSLVERLWRKNHDPSKLPADLQQRVPAKTAIVPGSARAAKAAVVPSPQDVNWINILPRETDDDIFALAADGDRLYAGGAFTQIAGTVAEGIAVWSEDDGWEALEDEAGQGIEGFVFAIAVSGDNVYVGGQFERAGGITVNNLAVWNRSTRSWSAVGGGVLGDGGGDIPFVSTLKVEGTDLYVGGRFSKAGTLGVRNIARWNGSSWSGLGEGIDGTVNTIEYAQSTLYAGGSFSRAGTVTSNGIAQWNGSEWLSLDGGVNGFVNEIKASGDSGIVVGGSFTREVEDSLTATNILWWTGTWTFRGGNDPFGDTGEIILLHGEVRSIVVDGLDMYVGGQFLDGWPRAGGSQEGSLNNITLFNDQPASWFRLEEGVNSAVNAVVKVGGYIFAGGNFTRAGEDAASHIAQWNIGQRRWKKVEPPTALTPIRAMGLQNGKLYAAGPFTESDPGDFSTISRMAELTSDGWEVVNGEIRGNIYSMLTRDDEIIIGGSFIASDEKIAVNLARWDSETEEWNPIMPGSGVAGHEHPSFVAAMLENGDDIYFAGSFTVADTILANNIVRFNTSNNTWHALGDGLNGIVRALAMDENGRLYAAGFFDASGTKDISSVAVWDGSTWEAIGQGVNGTVLSLAIGEGKLFAGGTFDTAGTEWAPNVAQWDFATQEWSRMGDGLDAEFQPAVEALAYGDGTLFAAGHFDVTGADSIHNVARWSPLGWWGSLGSGTDRPAWAIVISPENGNVYFGGTFFLAGCKEARYTALWRDPTLSVGSEPQPFAGVDLIGRPNPFTDDARIAFRLPAGHLHNVSISLFDLTGREVRSLYNGEIGPGEHTVTLRGESLPAGAYILRFRNGEATESMTVIKQ